MKRANDMRIAASICTAMVLVLNPLLRAATVEEKFDSGKIRLRYTVDAKNRKNGDYQEFFETGKPHLKGRYLQDKKVGPWITYGDSGHILEMANFNNDLLEGAYQWNYPSGLPQMRGSCRAGELVGAVETFDEKGAALFSLRYPNAWGEITKAYKTWAPVDRANPRFTAEPRLATPFQSGALAMDSQQAALNYVKIYRWLAGLPVTGMSIDAKDANLAQHAAVILHELGALSHDPKQPVDMDDEFFKLAHEGAGSSNISQGRRNLFDSIDDYMNDSDEGNIQRVGHRQWILHPPLRKTGFGYADGFSAMYVFDNAFDTSVKWTFIAYPSPGYYPHKLLADDAAWSISLNSAVCKLQQADLKIQVSKLDEHFKLDQTGEATVVAVTKNPTGSWPCVIFKPGLPIGAGRYVVQVKGIESLNSAPAPLVYLVHVRDFDTVAAPAKAAGQE